jgi:hypothetical protein
MNTLSMTLFQLPLRVLVEAADPDMAETLK